MPTIDALKIVPADAGRVLTKDQQRFNTLVRQIEQARTTLQAWQDGIAHFGQAYVRVLAPLQTECRATRRQWVFALQSLVGRRGWTRADRETIGELICGAAGELLAADDDDAELKAVLAQHADAAFDEERLQALHALKDLTESMTGLDLGDEAGIANEEDLLRRLHHGMQQQAEAADARREAAASGRRQTAAQRRRDEEAQQATRSVREVFRKLASALHPDRETDAAQRDAKTALMQQVNQAYARNDLLALLELQLRIEQVDAGHMAAADAQRVRHYNKVLAEQLGEIRVEIADVEARFRGDFGLPMGAGLKPSKLGQLLQQQERALKGDLALVRQELRLFDDAAATKRWLKAQRRLLNAAAAEFF